MKSATNLSNMFKNCYSLTSISLSKFEISNVNSLSSMFESCGKLTSLDLTHFVTSKVTDMSNMFNNCTSLKTLKLNFDTKNVQKMPYMFGSCTSLTSLDITMFNTVNCYIFEGMFDNDKNLNLFVDFDTCSNMKTKIPEYVVIHNKSEIW